MGQEGIVSIWYGNFANEDEFEKYVEESYSEDSDDMTSEFMNDMGIDYYDEDFREAIFTEEGEKEDIKNLIGLCSYSESFIEEATKELSNENKANAIFVIYDFKYSQEAANAKLQFLGGFSYEKEVDISRGR